MGTQTIVAGIHLNNTTGSGVAGGSTGGATTTPFVIVSYKLLGPASRPIWAGGAPFRSGRTLVARTRDNVVEQLELLAQGSSRDDAVAQIRALEAALNTALSSAAAVLSELPHGMTNAGYAEIYTADVQYDERLFSAERTSSLLRFTITWERSPFFGVLSSGETVVNAASVVNAGTGSPDNVEAYASGSGDLATAEGQPMNVAFTPTTASKVVHVVYLASCYSRAYTTTGAATATTSSQAAINSTPIPFDASAAISRGALKPRCLVQFSALSAAAEVRVNVAYKNGLAFFTSEWTASASVYGNVANALVDLGTWPLPAGRRVNGLSSLSLDLYLDVRSTDGTSVTATIASAELLLYYTFCRIDTFYATLANQNALPTTAYLLIDGFAEQSNVPCLPQSAPAAWHVLTSGAEFRYPYVIRGTPPRYYSGASLYVAWMSAADALHAPARTTTDTATITARQAPLYRALRGAG